MNFDDFDDMHRKCEVPGNKCRFTSHLLPGTVKEVPQKMIASRVAHCNAVMHTF